MRGEGAPDIAIVRRLVDTQFPQWRALPLTAFPSAGVDNSAFRLGDAFIVRVPRDQASAVAMEKELAWLPRLAGKMSIPIPRIAGAGAPSGLYPWAWSVSTWIEGATLSEDRPIDWRALALALAQFIAALRALPPEHALAPGAHNFGRGEPIALRDAVTRAAIDALDDRFDKAALRRIWRRDSSAPQWDDAPCSIHGDLHGQNILLDAHGLCGVIDFGCLGVGDPACDLSLAWRLLPTRSRDEFRQAVGADAHAWARGRAWALSISAREIAHYGKTAPVLTRMAERTLAAIMADAAD